MASCQGVRLPIHRWACVKHLGGECCVGWSPGLSSRGICGSGPCMPLLPVWISTPLQQKRIQPGRCADMNEAACNRSLCPDLRGWHSVTESRRHHLLAAAGSCPTAASPLPSGWSTPWPTAAYWQCRRALLVVSCCVRPWHTVAARASLTRALLCADNFFQRT